MKMKVMYRLKARNNENGVKLKQPAYEKKIQ